MNKTIRAEVPLFSFCIAAYNNYCYITETLDSLFAQTYPSIELLISNDGSPDFDEEELARYIEAHKGTNIQRVLINNNETNLGTVQNVEFLRSHAQGEYLMYMAADDALYDETVLSRYAQTFAELGEDALLLTCRTAMCTHELGRVVSYAPGADGEKAIKTLSSEEMFSRLTHTFTIPTTSTCYRRALYEKLGGYDTDYYIIEDAPLYIRMAREGIKFHWIDNMVGARHRDGGISHGNTMNLSEGYRRYRYDEIIFFKKEVLPYKKRILPQDLRPMQEKWNYIQNNYDRTFVLPYLTRKQRMMRRVKHAPAILMHMMQRLFCQVTALLTNSDVAGTCQKLAFGGFAVTLFVMAFSLFGLQNFQLAAFAFRVGCVMSVVWMGLLAAKLIHILWRALWFVLLGR